MSLVAAFILGLAGSLHCAAMCGPLTLALAGARRQASSAWPWLHHGGRLATYAILGAISGTLGAAVVWAGFERWLSIGAGATVLILALRQLYGRPGFAARLGSRLKSRFVPLLRSQSKLSTIGLGALNGLLPCGLVYVACVAAAASGTVLAGVAVMLAFGLGTAPLLFGIHFTSRSFRWTGLAQRRQTVLVCAIVAGCLLIFRGMALGVPYLSPSIGDGKVGACCHKSVW